MKTKSIGAVVVQSHLKRTIIKDSNDRDRLRVVKCLVDYIIPQFDSDGRRLGTAEDCDGEGEVRFIMAGDGGAVAVLGEFTVD